MKNIMWKYFTANNRSIKLTPTDARNPASYQHVHNALIANVNARKATSPKFHVGDEVLITRKKGRLEKGFTPNWREEVFTLSV